MQEKPTTPEVPEPIYVNFFQMHLSPFDIVLEFGQKRSEQFGKSLNGTSEVKVRLVMSPVHAKAMQEIMGELLATYEKEVGTIPTPKRQQKPPAKEKA